MNLKTFLLFLFSFFCLLSSRPLVAQNEAAMETNPTFPDAALTTMIQNAAVIRVYHLQQTKNAADNSPTRDSLLQYPILKKINPLYSAHARPLTSVMSNQVSYQQDDLVPKGIPADLGFELITNNEKLLVIVAARHEEYHVARFYLPDGNVVARQLTIGGRNNFIKLAQTIFPREYLGIQLLPETSEPPAEVVERSQTTSENTNSMKEKPEPEKSKNIHIVKEGETWRSIAQTYSVTKSQLKDSNRQLKRLKKGKKLKLPANALATKTADDDTRTP